MNDITFFCLVAKAREAAKKYFKEKKTNGNSEKAKMLLIQSKELEKYIDAEISQRINNKVYTVEAMRQAWADFKPPIKN